MQHLFISPKKATNPDICAILKEVTNSIGLVIINKVHLVYKQGIEFQKEFGQLYELRALLRQDIVIIGTSATVSNNTLEYILKNRGFRALGNT